MRRSNRHRPPRGGGRGRSGKPQYSRRTPPPERTGLESAFLTRIQDTQETVEFHFKGGETVRGKVKSFDRDTIEILREDGAAIVYRKTDLRFLAE